MRLQLCVAEVLLPHRLALRVAQVPRLLQRQTVPHTPKRPHTPPSHTSEEGFFARREARSARTDGEAGLRAQSHLPSPGGRGRGTEWPASSESSGLRQPASALPFLCFVLAAPFPYLLPQRGVWLGGRPLLASSRWLQPPQHLAHERLPSHVQKRFTDTRTSWPHSRAEA